MKTRQLLFLLGAGLQTRCAGSFGNSAVDQNKSATHRVQDKVHNRATILICRAGGLIARGNLIEALHASGRNDLAQELSMW